MTKVTLHCRNLKPFPALDKYDWDLLVKPVGLFNVGTLDGQEVNRVLSQDVGRNLRGTEDEGSIGLLSQVVKWLDKLSGDVRVVGVPEQSHMPAPAAQPQRDRLYKCTLVHPPDAPAEPGPPPLLVPESFPLVLGRAMGEWPVRRPTLHYRADLERLSLSVPTRPVGALPRTLYEPVGALD